MQYTVETSEVPGWAPDLTLDILVLQSDSGAGETRPGPDDGVTGGFSPLAPHHSKH